jgi:hypothetical protein
MPNVKKIRDLNLPGNPSGHLALLWDKNIPLILKDITFLPAYSMGLRILCIFKILLSSC